LTSAPFLKVYNIKPARERERDTIFEVPQVPQESITGTPSAFQEEAEEEEEEEQDIPSSISINSFEKALFEDLEEEEEEEEELNMSASGDSVKLYLEDIWKNPSNIFLLLGKHSKKNT
jgi:hypothetical protein